MNSENENDGVKMSLLQVLNCLFFSTIFPQTSSLLIYKRLFKIFLYMYRPHGKQKYQSTDKKKKNKKRKQLQTSFSIEEKKCM